MSYPDRLVPDKEKQEMLDGRDQNGSYFIRHVECEPGKELQDYIDPDSKLIDPKCISHPTNYIIDYSLNLNGGFLPEDVRYEVIRNKERHHAPWTPGTEGTKPQNGEYHINTDRRSLFYLADQLYQLDEALDEDNTQLKVDHKPVNCNYWHFTLNWECEGELLQRKRRKGLQRKIRTLLQREAQLQKE